MLKTDERDLYKDCEVYKTTNAKCDEKYDDTCDWCPQLKKKKILSGQDFTMKETETAPTYTHNSDRKVYNVDFDGVINKPNADYSENLPDLRVINKVQNLYSSGNIIIIWTARWWDQANWLVGWLITNKVPFHGIMMGKGGSDFYVDDKGLSLEKFKGEK